MSDCKCHPLSAFHWRTYKTQIDWTPEQRNAVQSAKSTDVVNRTRGANKEPGYLGPLSNKASSQIELTPKRFHIFSKA